MEEDIKIIEENIDYNSLIFGNGNAELSEKLRSAIEHLIQSYKEDEAVIEEMAEEINSLSDKFCENEICIKNYNISCEDCIIEYFRNKVKGGKR